MAEGNEKSVNVNFSTGKLGELRVRAIFLPVSIDSSNSSPTTLTIKDLKIPLHRFGTWVFELPGNHDDQGKEIACTMGPVAAFPWALRRSYPEISAWVDDPSDCSFMLEFENGKEDHYVNEIFSGNMAEKLQEQLKEIGDLNLKRILIARRQSPSSKVATPVTKVSSNGAMAGVKVGKAKDAAKAGDAAELSTYAILKCRNLKTDIEAAKDTTEKLRLQTELALYSHSMGKIDDVTSLMGEVKILIPKIQPSQEKNAEILENLRKLTELYEKNGKMIECIEILLRYAELVHKVRKPEDRLELININLVKICEIAANMYKVKSASIQVSVNADSELGKSRPHHGSGTRLSQAQRLQGNGKRAFKKFKLDEALGHFEAAVKLMPNEPTYHLDKAEVYLAKGEMENCTDECNKARKFATGKREKARTLELLGEVSYRSYRAYEAYCLFEGARLAEQTPDILTKLSHLDNAFQRHLDVFARQTVGAALSLNHSAGVNPPPPAE